MRSTRLRVYNSFCYVWCTQDLKFESKQSRHKTKLNPSLCWWTSLTFIAGLKSQKSFLYLTLRLIFEWKKVKVFPLDSYSIFLIIAVNHRVILFLSNSYFYKLTVILLALGKWNITVYNCQINNKYNYMNKKLCHSELLNFIQKHWLQFPFLFKFGSHFMSLPMNY